MVNKNVFLGLGSNIGDRGANLEMALSLLAGFGYIKIEKISSFYETAPIGPDQRNFYNAVIKCSTQLFPHCLLFVIKNIEQVMGRKKTIRWGSRIIDIDILFFGNESLVSPNLTIAHKEIGNRLFVLIPLSEIAPRFKFPSTGCTIESYLKQHSKALKSQKVSIVK
ncbi:MAG: 2-amino-4-hydroxy-6-hydroxymethyldihydropteridine diphosphokinase [Elusimicrobiota bacterium]|jgi:2-amino-4-hydroxy-6-hydroxymethyldihydropteridine diphosphokinase|nr:2-amino-4-hydroxy-6-hydroxymethyldihydropteridine diphosphokinase [Elusimicrobiota bacterium]